MDKEFQQLVIESYSTTDLARKMGYYPNTYRIKKLRSKIIEMGIDCSHFSKNGLPPRKTIEKICPICFTKFIIKSGHKEDQITCSYACSNTYFSGRTRNKTPKRYTTICWRNHEKRCVVCGEDKIVAVHHMDENKHNNDPKNLVPLCPTHHHYWHSRFRNLIREKVEKFIANL